MIHGDIRKRGFPEIFFSEKNNLTTFCIKQNGQNFNVRKT